MRAGEWNIRERLVTDGPDLSLSSSLQHPSSRLSSPLFLSAGEAQEWVRAMLTTVGRGGDGQKIRDEILHIMHRNHIPETKGFWMEEWHQKVRARGEEWPARLHPSSTR